ncbi:hypothetical protein HJC23_005399 [Cyclotella cryptica]|uniref:Uncharacterized protein n=1 Tax=Cyclotella cryptica TaxID=29204 RepID=A0ABD3NGZ8_9STRA
MMGKNNLSVACNKRLLAFIILFSPKTIVVSSARAPSRSVASVSYTSGINAEKWLLEEEFHGASSAADDALKRNQKPEARAFPVRDEIEESRRFGVHHDADSWWDDEESDDNSLEMSQQPPNKSDAMKCRDRWRPWKSGDSSTRSATRSNKDPFMETSGSPHNMSTSVLCEEHPMRTDEWELDIKLSRLFSKEEAELFPEFFSDSSQEMERMWSNRKRQVMQFARNGYVKVLQDNLLTSKKIDASSVASSPTTERQRRREFKVGKWRIGHNGIAFDIPVRVCLKKHNPGNKGSKEDDPMNQAETVTVLHYHADIHLNKFGERPRMFRGVITRDRYSSILPSNFFRPVIGTFSAEGIGHDTVDTSYKNRGFGLSRQQIIQDRLCFARQK